ELIAVLDLALLGDVDADHLVNTSGEVVVVLTGEDAHADDLAGLTVRNGHGRVANRAGLLTEDGAQLALRRAQLRLTLRGDLRDADVSVAAVRTDADDTALIKVSKDVLGDVRDVAGDPLRAPLGVAGVDLVLLDVDRGQHVLLNHAL